MSSDGRWPGSCGIRHIPTFADTRLEPLKSSFERQLAPETHLVMKTLTLVVPYNEAGNISRLIPEILKHVPTSTVLVVDDNSPDGTADAVRALGDERVAVICRTKERGYGSATIAGF